MAFINSILSIFTQKRLAQIDFFKANPIKVQRDTLQELLTLAANTEYGRKYHFNTILTAEQYRERLPIVHYEDIRDLVLRTMEGQNNLLWPEEIKWFAKSSGTTDAKIVISEGEKMSSLFLTGSIRKHRYLVERLWLWGGVARFLKVIAIASTVICRPL